MTQLTNDTRALVPVFNEYGEAETLVYQPDGVHRLKGSPIHLLESACLYYGSSIQGRIEAARHVLGPHRKTPVVMDWHADAVFFPTIAKESPDCAWINFQHVTGIKKSGNGTRIQFLTGESIQVPVSDHTVQRQKQRSIELSYAFQKRFHSSTLHHV
ncbi:competence protein ComK [Exiguobacterium sp. SH0S2]|uniref:competence protein ComK n=1 Tax=Exiguobacterium sp. SH0S2 TaxID=2510950 RepID=UPI00103A13FE|nr:competence protein ComK [Exiguobacterium sp. SH0S2]TCI65846.1 competence protein ComK [Exiguobacterium sp. SH0S2]